MLANADFQDEQERYVSLAMEAIKRRGEGINRSILANETRTSRAKIDRLFPEENDLFDAIVAQWFNPLVDMMEEVVQSELPPNRKLYEFYARRFLHMRGRYRADPAVFALYCEWGGDNFDRVRSYIDLADHYLTELIAQAQAEGFLQGLKIDEALSLINQMLHCYTQPNILIYIDERLSEAKLARIINTLLVGLSAEGGGARGVSTIHAA